MFSITKSILAAGILIVIVLLGRCKNSPDCHAYTGKYNDRGKELTIEHRDKDYVLLEETAELPCLCNSKGQLEIQGASGPVVILLSDSAGKKRFCFAEDSLQEDCIYSKD